MKQEIRLGFFCSDMWPLRHRIIQDVSEVVDPCVWLGTAPTVLLVSSLSLYQSSGKTIADLFLSFCVESVWAGGVQRVVMHLYVHIWVSECVWITVMQQGRKSSRPQWRHKLTLSTGQIIKTLSNWDGVRGWKERQWEKVDEPNSQNALRKHGIGKCQPIKICIYILYHSVLK